MHFAVSSMHMHICEHALCACNHNVSSLVKIGLDLAEMHASALEEIHVTKSAKDNIVGREGA